MTAAGTQERGAVFAPYYRALVIDEYREQLISYLMTEFGFTPRVAAAMIDQLPELLANDFRDVAPASEHHLAERAGDGFFAYMLIGRTASGFVPSKHIDWVWERCMQRANTFFALCDVVVGRYLHHFPWDLKGFGPVDREEARRLGLEATRAAVAEIGPVDAAVFTAIALNGCNLCMSDSNGRRTTSAALGDDPELPPGTDGTDGHRHDYELCYDAAPGVRPADVLSIRIGPDQQQMQLTDA